MKLAKGAITKAVQQPDPDVRFYLFHGPDNSGSRALAERLLGSLGAEKFAVSGGTIKEDPASLADEAGAMALFGGPRAIWIEPAADEISAGVEALLEAETVESPVIAIAGQLRRNGRLLKLSESHGKAAAAASYLPEGRDAVSMVMDVARAHGLNADGSVAERIASQANNDRGIVSGEIAKFALYLDASPERPAELTHDTIDAVGADSGAVDRMRLGDLALDGDGHELLEELERGGVAPSEAVSIVRALQRRLQQVVPMRSRIEQGDHADAAMTSAGRSLFWKDKALVARLLRTWDMDGLSTLIERSYALEKGVMLEGQPELAALGEELVTVARVAQRRR